MFAFAYRDLGATLTLSCDNVLSTSYLLSLNRTVKIRSANGTIDEVSVFQTNATSSQGMIKELML